MVYKRLILACVFLAFSISAYAQRAELGLNIGASGYIGDLNQYNLLNVSGQNIGFFGRINFDPHFGLGLHYNYGKIAADDSKSSNQAFRDRNLNFTTTLNELAIIGNFNFFDLYSVRKKGKLSPFIFAGIGGLVFNPGANYVGITYSLRDKRTEGVTYKKYTLVIPYGAGLKYKMTDNLSLFAQIGYRMPLFKEADYLDDVSGVYVDTSNPTNPGIPTYKPPYNPSNVYGVGATGTQRGDSRKRDTYLFVNIGISYTFVSPKCFTF